MQVRDIMTDNPACRRPDTSLQDVARMMTECDCGAIPVMSADGSNNVAGIITDRDIVVRSLAEGRDPLQLRAGDCMTPTVFTVRADSTLEDCLNLMESRQIRRVVVTDSAGNICGMVSQADVARHAGEEDTAEVVREISEAA
jgi:CBS domain-containing protein